MNKEKKNSYITWLFSFQMTPQLDHSTCTDQEHQLESSAFSQEQMPKSNQEKNQKHWVEVSPTGYDWQL